MDTIALRDVIERSLEQHTKAPFAYGELVAEAAYDRARDRYAVIVTGWLNKKRVHSTLVHVDIIDGKAWIQRDDTERGVALDLVDAGVPKDQIVLAFRTPSMRRAGEFAVA